MCRLLYLLLAISAALLAQLSHAKPYKGAEVFSNQAYLYGRYEMRMQAANASGVLSTFFTYKDGSQVAGTFWEEIDIEIFGKNNATQWQSNIIYGTGPTHTEETHTESASLAEGYHTYVLEWTPEYVAWFVDGVEKRRITATSTVASLTSPQTLRFNIWSSESVPWVGEWDDSVLPVYQFINYIEYKTYNTTTKTFEGGWREDFDNFDSSRWGKASWTFDTNRVDFAPENVVVKNGILVLALTKENATGYSGTPPADESGSSSSAAISSSVASSAAVSSSSISSVAASVEASSSAAAVSSTAVSSTAASKASGGSGGGGGALHWLSIIFLGGLVILHRNK
ncbi:family 16 glycosylhydrolase [Cellvibrio sp. NN19]|uniref:family 16 glycosylhydrolase n=1 Tax=Cellvibrio chitinivorans TaxID=3102792 RepID=UPI002B406991|nr:family 16 glycosylhydrolase [Cellvibrio sp. NN19]